MFLVILEEASWRVLAHSTVASALGEHDPFPIVRTARDGGEYRNIIMKNLRCGLQNSQEGQEVEGEGELGEEKK